MCVCVCVYVRERERERVPNAPIQNNYAHALHTSRSTPQRQADHPSHFEDDEVIYGNLDYSKLGAKGNAGERWESYWKTTTMLRSPQHEEEKKQ